VGAVALGHQIHDFNPGLASNGVFWTIRIPDENVEVNLENATASMRLDDAEVRDFFSLANFFSGGKSIPGDVSFQMHWSDNTKRVHLHDDQNEFDAHVIEDTATLAWSAEEEGFKFVSDAEDTSTTIFAEIGSERNGAFF
jgi:hypothetical protein